MPKPYSKSKLEIRDLQHLSYRLGMEIDELNEIAAKAESMYDYEYKIKPSGKQRKLSKPKWQLKEVQRKLNSIRPKTSILLN